MADIVGMIAAKAGISPDLARKGLGVILTGLKKFAPELYSSVAGYIPDSGNMEAAYEAESDKSGSGGLMGSVSGLASKVLGGSTGDSAEMMQMFSKAGFSANQVKDFAPAAIDQLKTVIPPELVDQVCERFPGLNKVT